jgi:hypothetical protein
MYRDFLKTGELVLTINGEVQEPITHNWLVAPFWSTDKGPDNDIPFTWVKDFEIELNESHNPLNLNDPVPIIRGTIGILGKGDTKRAGLALLWRRKVVQGAGNLADSPDDFYRPAELYRGANSFERQRIIGEIDVSELKVTSFKDSVVWKEGQEEEALRKIKEFLNSAPYPVLRMARNFRALDSSKATKIQLASTIAEVASSTSLAFSNEESDLNTSSEFAIQIEEELPEPPRDESTNSFQSQIKLTPRFKSNIILEVKDQGGDPSWLRVKESVDHNWVVTLNREHPFMKSFTVADPDSLEPVLRIALAIGIAEIQGMNSGFESAGFLRIAINDLLRNYLSNRSDVSMEYENDEDD